MTISAADIVAMTDHEIAMHASGSYGPKKRNEMAVAIRRAALAELRPDGQRAVGSPADLTSGTSGPA